MNMFEDCQAMNLEFQLSTILVSSLYVLFFWNDIDIGMENYSVINYCISVVLCAALNYILYKENQWPIHYQLLFLMFDIQKLRLVRILSSNFSVQCSFHRLLLVLKLISCDLWSYMLRKSLVFWETLQLMYPVCQNTMLR